MSIRNLVKSFFTKPQIFYLAVIAFSLSFCFSFQLSNLSSIFKFLGASGEELPLLWLAPPLTGLLVQPLIGQISDDTVSRWGKRRPYIIGWGILAACAFSMLPMANSLMFALLLTWLIDCSLNGSSEGLRALTGDITTRDDDRSKAFAVQAFFAGIGGALGTSMPYIIHKIYGMMDNKIKIIAGEVPINLKISFMITGGILLASLIAMRFVKEKTYKNSLLARKQTPKKLSQRLAKPFRDLFKSIRKMPPRFRTICFIHSTTWLGIFIFWLYFTLTLAQNVYGLPLHADTTANSKFAGLLQKASLDSSVYITVYQYVSIAYALVLFFLSNTARIKLLHALSLLIGGVGMAVICFEHNTYLLLCSAVAIGIMWGSMLVLPYAIAMKVLPKGKIGAYLGIFNISITAPQILCALVLPYLFSYIFKGEAGYLLFVGGIVITASGFLWYRLEKQERKVQNMKESPSTLPTFA